MTRIYAHSAHGSIDFETSIPTREPKQAMPGNIASIGLVDLSGAPLYSWPLEVRQLNAFAERVDQGLREMGFLPRSRPPARPWPPGYRARQEANMEALESGGKLWCSPGMDRLQAIRELQSFVAIRDFLDPPATSFDIKEQK